jgi:hypothetical protein
MLKKLHQKKRLSCPITLEGSIKNIKKTFCKTQRGVSIIKKGSNNNLKNG